MSVPMEAVVDDIAMAEQEQLIEEARALKKTILNSFAGKLENDKDKAIRNRVSTEKRMLENMRQHYLDQVFYNEIKEGATQEPHRLTRDNLTAPAVKMTAARIADMLFPTNGDNWDIEPTPLPELVNPQQSVMTQQGPVPAADMQAQLIDEAKQRARRMKRHISDQLQECGYAAEGRQAIFDACLLGTGIIKGPFVMSQVRKTWDKQMVAPGVVIRDIRMEAVNKPAAKRVDPWNFFPQSCRDIKEADHCFELHLMTKKQVRALAKQPGFDADQINDLLAHDPDIGTLADAPFTMRDTFKTGDNLIERYTVWEYHGPIPKDCLIALEVPIPDDDNLTVFDGEVWFSQGTVIKAALSHVDGCDNLPYHVFCYEDDPNNMFGYGVPDIVRHDQRAADQLWHAMVLNAMMSAGPQIGVVKGYMEPENGKFDLSCFGPRVWAMKDDAENINKALSVFTIPNVTGALLPMYDRIKQNAQEHAMVPAILQDEGAAAIKTAAATVMHFDGANIIQRRSAKRWDDDITAPLLTAFYHWYMIYGDDEEAKGDYDIIPIGATHLLTKDLKFQKVMAFANFAASPAWAPFFHQDWVARQLVGSLDFDTEGALKTPAEIQADQQQQQQQEDPRITAEKIRQQTAQMQIEADRQLKAMDGQVQLQLAEYTTTQEQMKIAAQTKMTQDDIAATFQLGQLREQNRALVETLKVRAKQQEAVMTDQREREHKAGDWRMKAEDIASRDAKTQASLSPLNPN